MCGGGGRSTACCRRAPPRRECGCRWEFRRIQGSRGGGGAHTECGVLQALLIGRPERIVLRKKEPWAWLPGYRHVVDDTGNVKVL